MISKLFDFKEEVHSFISDVWRHFEMKIFVSILVFSYFADARRVEVSGNY